MVHLWYRLVSFLPLFFLFKVVGIITRHNLTHEFLQARLRQHYQTIWCPCPTVSVASSLLQACTHACILLGPHKVQDLPFGFSRAYQAWGTGKRLASQRIKGAAWAQSCWLASGTWFDNSWSRCFLPLSPSYLFPSDVVLTLCVLPFCFGVFLRVGKKNHCHYVLGKELQHLSLPPVWLPFPLPPLFLQLLPYFCEKGVAVTAERRYWSLQRPNSCSGGCFFAKAVLKNPAFWKYTALCKCSPLPMFFHCLHLFLISFLLPWGNVSAVMFLTADDFWEQLSRFGVQNGYISVTVWVYEYIYNMFINMFAKHLREGRSLSC